MMKKEIGVIWMQVKKNARDRQRAIRRKEVAREESYINFRKSKAMLLVDPEFLAIRCVRQLLAAPGDSFHQHYTFDA